MFGRKRIALLTHALEFYAKRDNYRRRGIHKKGDDVRYAPSPISQDHGQAARAALGAIRALDEYRPLVNYLRRLVRRRPKDLGTFQPAVPAPLTPATEADTNEA
jgi:hypothetical protein